MTRAIVYTPSDLDMVTRTGVGEVRGESDLGVIAFAWAVRNRCETDLGNDGRADWWGETPKDVVLKAFQFSCWNVSDPNREMIVLIDPTNPVYERIEKLVTRVFNGDVEDPTGGATHYFAIGSKVPRWASPEKKTREIGRHAFYAGIER